MNKLHVLDHGFVELIDHMGSDLTVVNAARVSFGKRKTEFDESDRKLIRYLLKHGHTSPLRHCQLQFHMKAPIFVLRQWMKHRISSEFNEVSSRYVELGSAEFYHPEKFREQSKSNKQGSTGEVITGAAQAHGSYDNAISQSQHSYDELRSLGVCKEQARCVMPVSQYSEVYWTASLQAVLHFLSLRLDSHAQWEIREFAKAVRKLVLAIFPVVVSEYEAIRDRSEADAKLAMCAVRLAFADVAFEGKPTPENIATLDSLRGELRSLFADYAHCYADEQ
jgi:thymidylate synthase (FAD)